jgi:tetratricopeptide (TPR) repeat protein
MRTGIAIVLGLMLLAGCAGTQDEAPVAEAAAHTELPFLNMDPSVEYVGENTCRDCHLEEFASSKQTGMGRAFYPMTADNIVEDFTADNELVVEGSGMRYRMIQRGDDFYQQQYMIDSKGAQIAFDERRLAWVIGSNHHSRSYVTEQNGKLFQAPVCWYPDETKWELCPGYEFKNDHFARTITAGCIHCHNGVMTLVEGEKNQYEQPYPHGIGCERCHGPGQLHVEKWSGGATPTGEPDDTIVHVRRLPQEERIEVCMQCHLGDAKASERVIRWDKEFTLFRPGQRISEAVVAFRYVQQTQWDFGLSAQTDRLIQSECYKQSGGKIECLTCHNPHITIYHEDRPDDYFRQRCLGCHVEQDCVGEAEARQATAPAADDCVQCHMRKAEPDDQRFTEFTDHWIRRDIDLEERDHREIFDVEPIFPEQFAELSPGEQWFYRGRAESLLGRDAPMSKQPPIWVKAESSFRKAIEEGFDTVHSWFFLGEVLSYQNKHRDAYEAYAKAYTHDPSHEDGAFAYGQALMRGGRNAGALEVFRGMLERDPGSAMALAEAGRVASAMGQYEEALEYFDRAIVEEPWEVTLHINRAKVLATIGEYAAAAEAAREVVRLDPDNPDSWYFYEKSHEAAGLMEAAAEGRRFVERLRDAENIGG